MSYHPLTTLSAATTGMLVGAAMVSTRVVSADASPETLAFLRYLIGLCILGVPVCLGVRARFSWKDAAAISGLGVLQFAVLIVLLNYALETLPAATCALVFSTMPLFTICLGVLSRRESFSMSKLSGLTLAVAGIVFLLGSDAVRLSGNTPTSIAFAALLAATITGAVCSLLYRPYLQRYPALPTSALAMSAAVVFLSGLCWATAQPVAPRLSAMEWANVGFIGLSSGLGYFCWLWALARMEASRVVAFQALGPVTAAIIEHGIARQPPSWSLLLSLAFVVSGLLVALRGGGRQIALDGSALQR